MGGTVVDIQPQYVLVTIGRPGSRIRRRAAKGKNLKIGNLTRDAKRQTPCWGREIGRRIEAETPSGILAARWVELEIKELGLVLQWLDPKDEFHQVPVGAVGLG